MVALTRPHKDLPLNGREQHLAAADPLLDCSALAAGPEVSHRAMPDGERPRPGGWNRIHLVVDDLAAEVARLRAAGVHFRNDTCATLASRVATGKARLSDAVKEAAAVRARGVSAHLRF